MSIILKGKQEGLPWRRARHGVLTGSVVKSLIKSKGGDPVLVKPRGGRSPMVYDVAHQRMTPVRIGDDDGWVNADMERGTRLEPDARADYAFTSGNQVDEVMFVYRDDDKREGASPDGLVGDDGGIEIKCPNTRTLMVYRDTGIVLPDEHIPQMQWLMWVAGREWCDFVVYCPPSDGDFPSWTERVVASPLWFEAFDERVAKFRQEVDEVIERTKA